MTEQPDLTFNNKLIAALKGRVLKADALPRAFQGAPMYEFWGEDIGFPESDMHSTQAYRIYLEYDADLRITDAWVRIDGEILSPCSGYSQEVLDQFDYKPVLDWCLAKTAETDSASGLSGPL